jgi:hypothetical protein
MKKKNRRQIKATYREIQRNFKPKIGKVTLRISFFEQSPSFATNHLVSAMNSQRYHVLRRPTLQDLRRLKFTTQSFREGMTTHELTSFLQWHHKRSLSILPGDVNLRGRVIMFRTSIRSIIIPVITAATALTIVITKIFFSITGVLVILSFRKRF